MKGGRILQLLFGIALICSMPLRSAASLDSLRNLYRQATSKGEQAGLLGQLAFELSKTNPDSALLLSRRGLRLGKEGGSEPGISDCLNAAGWSYYTLGKDDSAILYLDSAVHLFHKIKAPAREARTLINLSCVYNRQRHYEQALGCLLPARRMLEGGTDATAKAYAELQIGIVYRQEKQYGKALIYLKSAVANFRKAGTQSYIADALSSLGGLYIYLDKPDSSLYCYRQALTIYHSLKNTYGTGLSYENTGDAYLIKATHNSKPLFLDSSLLCYQKAKKIFASLNDANDVIYEEFNIGKTLRRMKHYGPATTALVSSFDYFDSTAAVNNAFEAAQELAILYKEQEDFREALRYTELVQQYKDTLDARNRSGDMAEMLARYETERKDNTIRLLNIRQLLYRQQLSRGRVVVGFSGLMIVLAAALVFVAFSRSRVRRQLREVSLRNQLARDLHDDVGSSLSSIMLLSKMGNTEGLSGIDLEQRILEKIALTSRDIMERMSDIVWSMNPKYDRFINLKEKIETHFAHVREIAEISTQVEISEEIARLKLPMDLRKNLFLIVKEAVNNTLKYSGATELRVHIFKRGDKLFLIIRDDGRGFDIREAKEGNGMDSMRQRAAASGGSFSIATQPGSGTEITIEARLPYTR